MINLSFIGISATFFELKNEDCGRLRTPPLRGSKSRCGEQWLSRTCIFCLGLKSIISSTLCAGLLLKALPILDGMSCYITSWGRRSMCMIVPDLPERKSQRQEVYFYMLSRVSYFVAGGGRVRIIVAITVQISNVFQGGVK